METHIVAGLLRGNKVMAQKNMMMGQRITYQNQEIEERECFKLYALVNLFQVVYTCRYTKQKVCIHMHAISQKENHVCDGKLRFKNTKGACHGISPQYLAE